MKPIILALLLSALPQLSYAHEGHDKAPGAMPAPHGGSVQGTSELYVEVVTTKDGLTIYPLSHDGKALPAAGITLKGEALFPRKNKVEKLSLLPEGDSFSAKVEAKGAYRYTLELSVAPKGKKEEKLKFNVEPK
jgi:hypothetical protein